MNNVEGFPLVVFVVSVVALWLSALIGDFFRRRIRPIREGEREYLSVLTTAALTLLALIIGFSFSMGVSRYDQRKNYEEAEANAIGAEYVRSDFLPAADGTRVRVLLRN